MANALELHLVSKIYEVGGVELVALDHVDLTLAANEVVTLLGPSGSGKTTLLSIAGGLLSPTSGRVVVGGEDVTKLNARKLTRFRRERVGFIFQAVNLVPFLTARENLMVVAELARRKKSGAKARAERLLDELGLGRRMDNLPAQLSGGERQRVAIGRALMNAPELVLVDEPTSALDSDLGQQVMELIVSEVKARGAAAVVVTHDARITRFGDRILNMADGRIAGIAPRPEWTTQRPAPTDTPAADAPVEPPIALPTRRAVAALPTAPAVPAPPAARVAPQPRRPRPAPANPPPSDPLAPATPAARSAPSSPSDPFAPASPPPSDPLAPAMPAARSAPPSRPTPADPPPSDPFAPAARSPRPSPADPPLPLAPATPAPWDSPAPAAPEPVPPRRAPAGSPFSDPLDPPMPVPFDPLAPASPESRPPRRAPAEPPPSDPLEPPMPAAFDPLAPAAPEALPLRRPQAGSPFSEAPADRSAPPSRLPRRSPADPPPFDPQGPPMPVPSDPLAPPSPVAPPSRPTAADMELEAEPLRRPGLVDDVGFWKEADDSGKFRRRKRRAPVEITGFGPEPAPVGDIVAAEVAVPLDEDSPLSPPKGTPAVADGLPTLVPGLPQAAPAGSLPAEPLAPPLPQPAREPVRRPMAARPDLSARRARPPTPATGTPAFPQPPAARRVPPTPSGGTPAVPFRPPTPPGATPAVPQAWPVAHTPEQVAWQDLVEKGAVRPARNQPPRPGDLDVGAGFTPPTARPPTGPSRPRPDWVDAEGLPVLVPGLPPARRAPKPEDEVDEPLDPWPRPEPGPIAPGPMPVPGMPPRPARGSLSSPVGPPRGDDTDPRLSIWPRPEPPRRPDPRPPGPDGDESDEGAIWPTTWWGSEDDEI